MRRQNNYLVMALLAIVLQALSVSQACANSKYASIVVDAETGGILQATNATETRHPASLTKMMTLFMTFKALDQGKLNLQNTLPVSSFAASQSPSKLGLRTGQQVKVEHLILGLVTQSANDAAVVLAEALAGSEERFGQMMTKEARAIGMTGTRFVNASGLPDPRQITTARDMAILSRALLYAFPHYYGYFSRASFTYKGVKHDNHNRLMQRYDGMDGIKTGFIRASGFNLAASAKRDGRRLIAVVFGGQSARSRDDQVAELLNDTFARIGARPNLVAQTRQALPEVAANADSVSDNFMPPNPARRPDFTDEPTQLAQAIEQNEVEATENAAPVAANIESVRVAENMAEKAVEKAKPELVTPKLVELKTVAPKTVAPTAWSVQVGAFADRAASLRAVAAATERLATILTKADKQVVEVQTNQGALYRARLSGLDRNTAQTVCRQLTDQGQSCLLLPPA